MFCAGAFYILSQQLGLGIGYWAMFALAAPILVYSAVPISIGGWGIREARQRRLCSASSAYAPASAVALSIAFGLLMSAVGIVLRRVRAAGDGAAAHHETERRGQLMRPPRICSVPAQAPLNARKAQILEHANRIAGERGQWIERNSAYYADDRNFMRFLVPKGIAHPRSRLRHRRIARFARAVLWRRRRSLARP